MSRLGVTALRRLTLDAAGDGPPHVSAASGLARAGDFLYVVADDEMQLGVFPVEGRAPGRLLPLLAGELPPGYKARKRAKPDFESLARLPGALLALGSCSKANRCKGLLLTLEEDGALRNDRREFDATPLREALEARFGRPNIEGAYVAGDELHLLQRGNKGDRRNARIRLRLDAALHGMHDEGRLDMSGLIGIEIIDLGSVGEVPLCFTDGVALPDGRVVFSAVAEDVDDSYADGPCRAAAVGVLDARGVVERLDRLEPCEKVEGLEAWLEDGVIRALAVTDPDDRAIASTLLALELRP